MKTVGQILEWIDEKIAEEGCLYENKAKDDFISSGILSNLFELRDFIVKTNNKLSCPDGGTCHHFCKEECFRVKFCSPLSGVFKDDQWPKNEGCK